MGVIQGSYGSYSGVIGGFIQGSFWTSRSKSFDLRETNIQLCALNIPLRKSENAYILPMMLCARSLDPLIVVKWVARWANWDTREGDMACIRCLAHFSPFSAPIDRAERCGAELK